MTNQILASHFREFAELLAQQGADGFRIEAYRKAAGVLERMKPSAAAVFATKGRDGLIALPAIGRSIATALAELLTTGRWSQLERLRGTLEPEKVLQTIPGIGPELANRICDELQAETLETLEMAAHDGSLERIAGFGPRRTEMVRVALAERLGRPRLWRSRQTTLRPAVGLLLEVDREHRAAAAAGSLRKIAPRRFNPDHLAWLPILHTRRGPWEITALYSNSARAHALGKTGDWVIIYYQSEQVPEGQCTVVTETRGPAAGQRVVRGRELESHASRALRPQPRSRKTAIEGARTRVD
jgi:hypothetical protein